MDNEQNWYRQLAALVLLSASRAAVEYINNPVSREDAQAQLKEQFANIDYDAAARAITGAIDSVASTSKDRLSGTIDVLRDKSVDVVEGAKEKAAQQVGQPKKSGRKLRFLFGLVLGAIVAYFVLDEQRRDDLLDKLTGASGPIQQSAYTPTPYTPSTPAPSSTPPPSTSTTTMSDTVSDATVASTPLDTTTETPLA